MITTQRGWLRVAAPLALCALTLTACSDSDSDSDSAKESSPAAETESSAPATEPSEEPATESSPPADNGAVEETPPGELQSGKSAFKTYEEDDDVKPTYEILAQKIELGTAAEAQEMVDDPEQVKGMIPAIAHVKYTHRSGPAVEDYPRVGAESSVYVDGRRGGRLISIGGEEPKGCIDSNDIKNWQSGQSYVMCTVWFVPENSKSLEIQWAAEAGEDPFIWKFNA